jgi:thymidylate synthase
MSTPPRFNNATAAWQHQLEYVLEHGHEINPRGKPTVEVQRPSLRINMNRPNVCVKPRKLGYSFMAAEALWMIRGDDTVDGIATWNSNIAQFSDDGETFFGAYGPKIVGQSDYVVDKLIQDPNTRQAVLTIWRENPPESNDIPCTVSMELRSETASFTATSTCEAPTRTWGFPTTSSTLAWCRRGSLPGITSA